MQNSGVITPAIVAMRLEFYRLRFRMLAQEIIYFPTGKAGNILRGAFGTILRRLACHVQCNGAGECPLRGSCPYARIFEPAALDGGHSGMVNRPRPFVFRAAPLNGVTVLPGGEFSFDLNLFRLSPETVKLAVLAFEELAREGLGATRGKAELLEVQAIGLGGEVNGDESFPLPCKLSLLPSAEVDSRIEVSFRTPTELKAGNSTVSEPEFPVLMARIRDRISALTSLYGAGTLDGDRGRFVQRAAAVRMIQCNVTQLHVTRFSSRTQQRHSLGGFVGSALYEGDTAEFLPLLRAAEFTGVGRHTSWGNGELQTRLF